MQKIKEKFFGDKKFYMTILAVALPLMFQQLVTSSVNLVDNLMVGELGDFSLSGVAAVNKYYMIAFYGINGIMGAATVFIAQFYGAKNEEKMKESFRVSILCGLVVAIPFTLIGAIAPQFVVSFFNKEAMIVSEGAAYLAIVGFGFIPLAISLAIAGSMRAVGDTKTPLIASVTAVLTNVVFNYLLIFGHYGFPQLGVAGAAIATLMARVVESIMLVMMLAIRQYPFKTKLQELTKFSKHLLVSILKKGAPLALNEVLWASGMAMLFMFYSTRGSIVMAGHSIAGTTSDLFFTLFGGMAVATTVLVSQPLGANKLEEAKSNAYRLLTFSIFLALIFAVLLFSASFIVPNFYQNVSPESRVIASNFLKIMACFFFIYMANTECYFILRAGGDMKSTLFMDSGYMWCVNLPVVACITYLTNWPIYYIYIAGQLTDIVKLAIAFKMLKKEKWLKNLTHQEAVEALES